MPTSPKASQSQNPCPKEEESLERSFGILHRPGTRPAGVKEMDEAIGRFHAEEEARIRKGSGAVFGMLRRPDIPPRTLEEMRKGMINFLVQEDERIKRGEE